MTTASRTTAKRSYKLGVRLVSAWLVSLSFALAMVSGTLWLSWALEGAAAAINDTGSLRMRSIWIGLDLQQPELNLAAIDAKTQVLNDTLSKLIIGDPQRPLRLPNKQDVQQHFTNVQALWQEEMRPLLVRMQTQPPVERTESTQRYLTLLPTFVEQTNQLVLAIEAENARATAYLRASQFVLIGLIVAGGVAIIYLLYGWIIRPIEALRDGISKMAAHNFDIQIPVEDKDEFGELAEGFNNMAAQLKELYTDLENKVAQKTRQLAQQNRELSTLYDFSAYLSQPGELEQRCEGFLAKLIDYFGADGGTVRILNPRQNTLHLAVHQGLSLDFIKQEQCLKANDCLCGQAMDLGLTVLHDFRALPQELHYRCHEEGFNSIAIAQINNAGQKLGSYTLLFVAPRKFSTDERRLFDAVGQHLGVAIENQRLVARTRELAMAEERHLVAQGLHDSIAQGLNFLKLQIQMLDDSLERGALNEVRDVMALIQTGIHESYEDVRELLTNFRVKLNEGDLVSALHLAAQRFTRQTGVPVTFSIQDDGPALPPAQQLQVLFIAQEALSNVRKHARATTVHIDVKNTQDFFLQVSDDGCGFDVQTLSFETEGHHVGINIMQERATRLGAKLDLVSEPGKGSCIELKLAQAARIAA